VTDWSAARSAYLYAVRKINAGTDSEFAIIGS
jgi:hypothetical protein